MVKNYTRPGFQFVPGNGRSTFLLSRAQSEPIVRDEYFKTNTRNFYPMFAQFCPRSQCFYVPFDLGRGARRFIDSFHAPPFRATTYIVFLRPNRRAYPPIASSYLSWCHWLSYCCGTYILYANRTVSQIQSSLRLYNVAIRLTTQVLIIMYPLG